MVIDDEIKKIVKSMKVKLDQIRESVKIVEPWVIQAEIMRKSMSPWFEQIKKIQATFIPIFSSEELERLRKKFQEMHTPTFKKFVKEWGWFVNKMPVRFGDYCFVLYKKHGEKGFKNEISRWFYHKKNLNRVFKILKDKFPKPRMEIIREAFEYHHKRNYSCSITLLLPQTEGILWDLGMKIGLVKKGYNSTKTTKKRKKIIKSDTWELHKLSKELFPKDKEDRFHTIIVHEVFCEGFRNKILHGRNIYRGKEKEISRWRSTLLILTLWRLSEEF